MTPSDLARAANDSDDYPLSDWITDDRQVTVFFTIREADHDNDYPTVTVIGAVYHGRHDFDMVMTRAEFADMIGEEFVAKLEQAKSEK